MAEPAETIPTPPHAPDPPSRASVAHPAPPPEEALPAIPGFEILGLLGRGGMGAVYRARQLSLNREVAVKMILAGPAGETTLARFRREAEGIARLRHPNIVQIYEVGQVNGQPYLVLELVGGGSLKDRLGDTPQPAADAARLLATLARAVHAAHLAGVVHRDLKPANILLGNADGGLRIAESKPTTARAGSTAQGPRDSTPPAAHAGLQPKVTDFGLAKFLGDEAGQTRTGDILGTPGYMAPEQASGRGKEIGPGTDVWALGVILYEALTGARPFRARDIDVLLAMIRTEDPVPPGRVAHGIPRDLETICLTCLRKESGKRYPTAEALADDLDRFLTGRPILARPVGTVERAWKWVRRNKALTGFLLTVAAALVAAAGGFALHSDRLSRQLAKTTEAEQQATREAEAKGRALEEKTRAEAQAGRAASEKLRALEDKLRAEKKVAQALTQVINRQVELQEGNVFAAVEPTLEILKVIGPTDPERVARERQRLGMLFRHGPKLVHAWTFEKPARQATISPDGKLVAVVGDDGRLRLYDAGTGEPAGAPLVHRTGLLAPPVPVQDVVFTPDGKTILTAAGSPGVFAWDVGSRRATLLPAPRGISPTRLALSRDGRRLLTSDQTGSYQVWDLAARAPLTRVHESWALRAGPVLSPDGLRVAAVVRSKRRGGREMTGVQILVVDTQRPVGPPARFEEDDVVEEPNQLAFTPDGTVLLAIGEHRVKAWSAADGSELATPAGPTASAVGFSPDGRFDVRVGARGIRVRRLLAGREEFAAPGAVIPAAPPVFSPDGLLVAVARFGGVVQICNRLTDGRAGTDLQLPHPAAVTTAAFAPDSRRVLTVCADGVVRLWDLAGRDPSQRHIPGDGLAAMIAYSPDGRYVAKAVGTVYVYDAATLQQVVRVDRSGLRLFTAEFSRDGRRVLAASPMLGRAMTPPNSGGDLGWVVWDVAANRRVGPVLRFPAGDTVAPRFAATISPDGRHVAWAGNAEGVQVTDVETGRPLLPRPIPLPGGGTIDGLAFSPDGTRLAVKAKHIRVFDAATGEPAGPELELPGELGRLAFSPDGRRLAVCSVGNAVLPEVGVWARGSDVARAGGVQVGADGNGLVRVWDARTGDPLTPLLGLADQPTALALRPPRGDHLLVASFDGTVRAWDIDAGRPAFRDLRHSSAVMHAAYSGDGQWIGYTDLIGFSYLREAGTGALMVPPIHHPVRGKGFWVAFRPDGRQFGVTTAQDMFFWDLTPEGRPVAALEQVLRAVTGEGLDPTGRAARQAAPDLFRPGPAAVLAWHHARYAELRAAGEPAEAARPHLDALLAESPRDASLLTARAECHVARGDWAAALADLDAADAGKGIDPHILLLRGRVHLARGEARRALAALDDAVELSPALGQARLYRGKTKLALGDWAGADQDIADAMARGSVPIPDACAMALARLLTGRTEPHPYDTVCRAVNQKGGLTTDPDQAALMAVTFSCGPAPSLGPEVAVGLATRAAGFDPSSPDYRFALGLALFRAGKAADALRFLNEAEKADVPAVRLKARLALALAAPEAEAKDWLAKARADLKEAEAELAEGRSLPGTAWAEVEVLRRQAEARLK